MSTNAISLLIGTRKGAFILHGDGERRRWQLTDPIQLGHIVHHMVLDPRDGRTILLAASTGHLGPTLFRSTDGGATWQEAARPPAFPKAPEGEAGRVVDHIFWLTPGHASEPGVWYAGVSPVGLFRSEDGGVSWEPVAGFNDHPRRREWTLGDQQAPPGGSTLHSIQVDPRDPNHLYIGVSIGGVFESHDRGASWHPLNQGIVSYFLPDPEAEYGHDAHCIRLHPRLPDRLYQQNHCGVYRLDRGEGRWIHIGESMPKEVGDIGFPIAIHPRDPDTAWVFPMDSSSVWPRVSPGGKPAAYVTRDAGHTWQRQDRGLPPEHGWFSVKRQAMITDRGNPAGVYFGTTAGEIWGSADEGETWTCLVRHLPEIYSVEVAEPPR